MGAIRINQMGYSLNSTKQVVYVGEGNAFFIYDANKNEIVLQGSLKSRGFDEMSGEVLCTGDFSALNQPGNYYIAVNEDKSEVFPVGDNQYTVCTDALVKAFYYQRCGVELPKQYASDWKHPVCHLQPSYLFCQDAEDKLLHNKEGLEQLDTIGGWHDAGDYGRYTIATVKTVADLMLAYEHFDTAFQHPTGIPESILEGADILHEIKIGLDWMFKMQRKDGAVYTKVATRHFPGMIMPDQDQAPLFVYDISSPATAGYAAAMAMASKIFAEHDKKYAVQCLDASTKAYQWLKQNSEPLFFKNPSDITSGEYGDNCDIDERYWAAAQLYRATKEEQYHNDFMMYYFMLQDKLSLGWRNVGGYGTIAYLFTEDASNDEIFNQLKNEWLEHAIQLEQRSNKDGYGITMIKNDYVWGSNMILMNQSIQLIIADLLMDHPVYDPIVQRNWDYLLGMNAMDISYVTGLGYRSVRYPHHRPSASDGVQEPVPGLVSGGPCASLIDEISKQQCQGLAPSKCFADHTESYSTNEVDIYWNSPTVVVGAYLCSR